MLAMKEKIVKHTLSQTKHICGMNENYTPCPNSFATSGQRPAVASP